MFAALAALAALALVDGKPLRVGVAGGGPAGLALAHALRTLPGPCDVHVSVYEKYSELRPAVGGGIQLSSGAAVLSRLGLGEELRKASMPLRGVRSGPRSTPPHCVAAAAASAHTPQSSVAMWPPGVTSAK